MRRMTRFDRDCVYSSCTPSEASLSVLTPSLLQVVISVARFKDSKIVGDLTREICLQPVSSRHFRLEGHL